ncbi:MAG: sulfatase-like hydrolase/transferase, partial [Planctomycetaceae bacterium]
MHALQRSCGLVLAVYSLLTPQLHAARPHILLAISDDHSFPHAGAYGDQGVRTPAFDQIAQHGLLFRNAFAASPGCSPSRAALLTGRNTWELEHAGTHASTFSDTFSVYPDLLEQAGYFVGYTGKGWGPGNFRDGGRTRNPAGPMFQRRKKRVRSGISSTDYAANFIDFLEQRPDEQPFCFWFGCHEPHRSYERGSAIAAGKSLDSASVP